MRKRKSIVRIGDVKIGGSNPIAVQSMTKTKTADVTETTRQIRRLERVGCELIRCAVVNRDDVAALVKIKESVRIPVIGDIHFDYRLAVGAIKAGVDKIRINPGNIGERWKVEEIIKQARDRDIPIRIGVNSGSLPKAIIARYSHPTVDAIVDSVRASIDIFADHDFRQIVVSAKGVDVRETINVYRILNEEFAYPLHVGITEAGLPIFGVVKSAVGLGVLLHDGIGDTIRVSLTADPVREVVAAYAILSALGIRHSGPILISCPMCGRCEVDLERIARNVEKRLTRYDSPMKIAVMGCVVNGPGEAREADFGIACGKGLGAIFAKGKEIRRVKESNLVETLFEVIDENIDN
jgi:(E)-4-hydroxy-3-methylbut-2-enyl-diphosphate synthase